jgi:membrane protease YdiL (CAAX protease family)
MYKSKWGLIRLAVIVIVWYLGLTYLPQIVGSCLDGVCGFTTVEIIVSVSIPIGFFAIAVLLEMVLHQKSVGAALSDLGVTRFNMTGIRLAVIYLLPLLAYFPLMSVLLNMPLATQPNWQWLVLSTVLVNGFAEETMMRGYVFRHLREGRSFWRGAVLSTIYFAGYHTPLILSEGLLIGVMGVLLAIPIGLLTAYSYERGENTIWGPVLLHVVNNALIFTFVFPSDVQPMVSSLYLLLGTVVSALILVRAYRG